MRGRLFIFLKRRNDARIRKNSWIKKNENTFIPCLLYFKALLKLNRTISEKLLERPLLGHEFCDLLIQADCIG